MIKTEGWSYRGWSYRGVVYKTRGSNLLHTTFNTVKVFLIKYWLCIKRKFNLLLISDFCITLSHNKQNKQI